MTDSRALRIWRLGARGWLDIALACYELGRARLRLKQLNPARFQGQAANSGHAHSPSPQGHAADRIERIGPAIQRAARIVPWRSDCLVQAEAARHWLARHGIEATIRLGARKSIDRGTEMHAWLISNDKIVTGGQITDFVPFE